MHEIVHRYMSATVLLDLAANVARSPNSNKQRNFMKFFPSACKKCATEMWCTNNNGIRTRRRSIKCLARATAFVLHGQFLSRIFVFHSELKQWRNTIFISLHLVIRCVVYISNARIALTWAILQQQIYCKFAGWVQLPRRYCVLDFAICPLFRPYLHCIRSKWAKIHTI